MQKQEAPALCFSNKGIARQGLKHGRIMCEEGSRLLGRAAYACIML
jgi:hypothetical protein